MVVSDFVYETDENGEYVLDEDGEEIDIKNGFDNDEIDVIPPVDPEIEFEIRYDDYSGTHLFCPKCNSEIEIDNLNAIINKCLRMLNMEYFKDATLIRLDDWYVPEIKKKEKLESGYWIHTDVKTDKDGDTIVVLYVGHKDISEKKSTVFHQTRKTAIVQRS